MRQAPVAGDVELYSVAHDFAADLASYGPQEPLDSGVPKLSDRPALDADRMVVVLDPRQGVGRFTPRQG